jgi:hypothetical protein
VGLQDDGDVTDSTCGAVCYGLFRVPHSISSRFYTACTEGVSDTLVLSHFLLQLVDSLWTHQEVGLRDDSLQRG